MKRGRFDFEPKTFFVNVHRQDGNLGKFFVHSRSLRPTSREKEWAFFLSLFCYEQMRWLYAFYGLSGLCSDLVRVILIDFMHVSCLERQCNRPIASLSERMYELEEAPLLFSQVHSVYLDSVHEKVHRERNLLLAEGVPAWQLRVIDANFPLDGLAGLSELDDRVYDDPMERLILPSHRYYACINLFDTKTVESYMDQPEGKIGKWQLKALDRHNKL